MADTEETPTSSPSSRSARTSGTHSSSKLTTERGTTTIADVVVSKVAGIAAREVGGVHRLGGAVARALGAVTQRLSVPDSATQGVSVSITDAEVSVELTVIIDYGEAIAEVTQEIRDNVIRRIEATTGLVVTAVDISVTDLYFPGDDEPDDA